MRTLWKTTFGVLIYCIDGTTWLSIFQNKPTTEELYEGTVEITGDIVGTCKYENGQYCGATGCNRDGCTVCPVTSPVH